MHAKDTEKEENIMFYSQLLLSKKGALGIVWLAAHCHRRLKKDQVHQTDISSSVDKILGDEVHVVTHRILAFLLLGIVRLYSKKVEYLFQDCHEVLNKLFGLKTAKRKRAGIGVSPTRYYSISLPKRFELDAFDLELHEDQDLVGVNVSSHEQDVLGDGRKKAGGTSGLILKEKMPFSEAYTPPRDVVSSHHVDQGLFVGPSSSRNISLSGLGVLRGSRFSLEDRVDPTETQLHDKVCNEDMATNLQELTNKSTLAPSLEKLRGTAFPLEDRLDPMILDEAEKEQLNDDRPSNDDVGSKFCGPVEEVEFDPAANRSPLGSNLVASGGVVHRRSPRFQHSPRFKMLDEAEKGKGHDEVESTKKFPMSVVVTPESKLQDIPEVAAVRTPATRERAKIPRKKRKMMFDSATVVSNKVFKQWMDDRGDLKREKRNIPTLLHAWRARKLGHVPPSFLEPSIPAAAVDLECKRSNVVATKLVELSSGQDGVVKTPAAQDDVVKPPVVARVECEQIGDIRSPSPIAPRTPVFTRLKSVRSHEAEAVADPDILEAPTSSSESVEKSPSLSRALDSDFEFRRQETKSLEGDSREKDTYSERTRMMGSYLGKKFLVKKKQKKEQVLNLSQLLVGKTKKESATLFYEILVLKTLDCIDVEQENAYGDILLWETGKLKQAAHN